MIASLLFAAAVAASSPDCAARIAAARPAIEHANGDWIRAMKAHDAPAIAAAYADDGLFVMSDGTTIKGRAAVEALYAKSSSAAVVTGGGIQTLGTACGGDGLVYEWGEGVLRARGADGQEHTKGGPYLTVWKDVGGQWRIVRNLTF
jgi:uncharacterized protein (TIGR02246 family)